MASQIIEAKKYAGIEAVNGTEAAIRAIMKDVGAENHQIIMNRSEETGFSFRGFPRRAYIEGVDAVFKRNGGEGGGIVFGFGNSDLEAMQALLKTLMNPQQALPPEMKKFYDPLTAELAIGSHYSDPERKNHVFVANPATFVMH